MIKIFDPVCDDGARHLKPVSPSQSTPQVAWTESSFNWYVKEGLYLKLQRLGAEAAPRMATPRERAGAEE